MTAPAASRSNSSSNYSTTTTANKPFGKAYVVGSGKVYGELGVNDIKYITHPVPIEGLSHEHITEVASSSNHTLVINRVGKMYSWGCDEYGALGREDVALEEDSIPRPINHPSMINIKFSQVACGNTFSMAISTKGQLYTWGTFMSHQNNQIIGYLPNVHVQRYPRIVNTLAKLNIVDIAAGASHCLALSDKGQVYSWGFNEYGQLGRPTKVIDQELYPNRIPELADIITIASGAFHSFAVDRFGRLYTWGSNYFQQCGLIDKVDEYGELLIPAEKIEHPTLVPYFDKPIAVTIVNTKSEVDHHKKMKLEDVAAKIEDVEGELGNISDQIVSFRRLSISDNNDLKKPIISATSDVVINAPKNKIKSISAGDAFTIIATTDNDLVVFGQCDGGQLGVILYPHYQYLGELKIKYDDAYAIGHPMQNLWHCEQEITKVVCGSNHTLILTKEGIAYGFGHSTHNQLGVYREEDIFYPTVIESLFNAGKVINASAGDRYSLFIVAK